MKKGPKRGHAHHEFLMLAPSRIKTPEDRRKFREELDWLRDEEWRLRVNMRETR